MAADPIILRGLNVAASSNRGRYRIETIATA
jgi:hypothetical protein